MIPSPSLGRFDQYTWPYLERDLAEGNITMAYAQEIVDAFFLKANCFYGGAPSKLVTITGIGNTYQHTTLGGVDPKTGEDATNPVTYMALETVGRLKLHDPTISLRFNKNSPDELWDCAIATSKTRRRTAAVPKRRGHYPDRHGRARLLAGGRARLRHHRLSGDRRLRPRLPSRQRRFPRRTPPSCGAASSTWPSTTASTR